MRRAYAIGLAAVCVAGAAWAQESGRRGEGEREGERGREGDRGGVEVQVDVGKVVGGLLRGGKPAPEPPITLYGAPPPEPTVYGEEIELTRGCRVARARLAHGAATPADAAPETPNQPLQMPTDYSAPAPGAAGSSVTGPSVGPIPGTAPAQAFAGNAFEYHSDVRTFVRAGGQADTADPCTSEQYARYILVLIDPARNQITGHDPNSNGLPTAKDQFWPVDRLAPIAKGGGGLPPEGSFRGYTTTGFKTKNDRNGAPFRFFQGTRTTIHWIDTPGLLAPTPVAGQPADTRVMVLIGLVRSVTYDGGNGKDKNKPSGWQCFSGHTVALDLATARPLAPARAAALFAAVRAKNGAPKVEKQAAEALNAPVAGGGFVGASNPEFRDLGCARFGPPPK